MLARGPSRSDSVSGRAERINSDGIDINSKDRYGNTAVHYNYEFPEVIHCLSRRCSQKVRLWYRFSLGSSPMVQISTPRTRTIGLLCILPVTTLMTGNVLWLLALTALPICTAHYTSHICQYAPHPQHTTLDHMHHSTPSALC